MKLFRKYKPGVSVQTHLLTASLIWSVVGITLMAFGWRFAFGDVSFWYMFCAVLLGSVKSFFLLDKFSRKNITRIRQFRDGVCLGGVYTIRMWIMVLCMVTLGRFLRQSTIPSEYIGLLYITVGWGLFLSSRILWKSWMELRSEQQ
ncbi:MAG: hypothetical protein KKE17_12415 [Proteobacteria bacterium]|nr:hypothetical protein [Pseudomonadota bacterium]MBU1710802.1 hypothetical protein [Pseudomonadota bacterium]